MTSRAVKRGLTIDCPLCGQQLGQPVLRGSRGFQVYRCVSCGLGQTMPYPPESNGQEYFTDSDEHYHKQYVQNRTIWRGYMASILDHARPYVSNGTLLDVGTGIGFMLELAQEQGFQATGIEPSPAAVRYARDKLHLDVVHAHYPAPTLAGRRFNLITISHVLEHVERPEAFLAAVKAQLEPGGVAVITAPSYDSFIVRIIGPRWYGFQPLQHIWQFTPKTVALLSQRSGLEVVEMSSESMDYRGNTIKTFLLKALAAIGARLNTGDQLVVVVKNADG